MGSAISSRIPSRKTQRSTLDNVRDCARDLNRVEQEYSDDDDNIPVPIEVSSLEAVKCRSDTSIGFPTLDQEPPKRTIITIDEFALAAVPLPPSVQHARPVPPPEEPIRRARRHLHVESALRRHRNRVRFTQFAKNFDECNENGKILKTVSAGQRDPVDGIIFEEYFAYQILMASKREIKPFEETTGPPPHDQLKKFNPKLNGGIDHINANDRRLLIDWMRERFMHSTNAARRRRHKQQQRKYASFTPPCLTVCSFESTFHLAVQLLDRFATLKAGGLDNDKYTFARLRRHRAQCVATACMWIACKYAGEVEDPDALDMIEAACVDTNKGYGKDSSGTTAPVVITRDDLCDAEIEILSAVHFDLGIPSAYDLVPCILIDGLRRIHSIVDQSDRLRKQRRGAAGGTTPSPAADAKTKKRSRSKDDGEDEPASPTVPYDSIDGDLARRWRRFERGIDVVERISLLLCEFSLYDDCINVRSPSIVAASCVVLARSAIHGRMPTHEDVGETWPYDPDDVEVWECSQRMLQMFSAATQSSPQKGRLASPGSPFGHAPATQERGDSVEPSGGAAGGTEPPLDDQIDRAMDSMVPRALGTWYHDLEALGVDPHVFSNHSRRHSKRMSHPPYSAVTEYDWSSRMCMAWRGYDTHPFYKGGACGPPLEPPCLVSN